MRVSRLRGRGAAAPVDLTTSVGSVTLDAPVLTAAGTSGTSVELGDAMDLSRLGAVTAKSLSAEPWAGNPPVRVIGTDAGMLNAIGLQNPGVDAWVARDLPRLRDAGATVVASVWARSVDEFARVASGLAGVEGVVAVEANISCPNLEARSDMFAHAPDTAAAATGAVVGELDVPVWVKLSPNVTDLVSIARAVVEAGAASLTLINTVMGMVIDTETRRPALGNGGGGLSGPAIRPVAVRALYDVRAALGPAVPLVGVGGVRRGVDAVELLMAGAHAVAVGTGSFIRPDAPLKVLEELVSWCVDHQVRSVAELVGAAHEQTGLD